MSRIKYAYGRNVLITGASQGIGRACALLFAQNGYNVYAASRRAEETTACHGEGSITGVVLDVRDEASISAARERIERECGGAGIVINCAGWGIAGAAEDTPDKDARAQFDTNFFGVLNVCRAFVPKMRERKNGLVLIIGSVAGRISVPFQCHYSASKAALETYCECLRMEAAPYGVRATIIEPGDTKTAFTAARAMAIPEGSPYREVAEASVRKMASDEQKGKSPDTVAALALRLAGRKRPPVRKSVGFFNRLMLFLRRVVPSGIAERIIASLYASK